MKARRIVEPMSTADEAARQLLSLLKSEYDPNEFLSLLEKELELKKIIVSYLEEATPQGVAMLAGRYFYLEPQDEKRHLLRFI